MPEEESKGMNNNYREIEFNRVGDMNLHIARTWYRPDFACGDDLMNTFDWNSIIGQMWMSLKNFIIKLKLVRKMLTLLMQLTL
ncbi:MAG TPA: hypothetical protein VIK72_00375 [Clostridiaceae bacterium]